MDEKRVADLRAIHTAIQTMTTKRVNNDVIVTRPLPKTLEEVAEFQQTRQAGFALNLSDPDTGDKYGYTLTGENTYELSVQFALERDKKRNLFWNHPAGKHGFKFNAQLPP